MSEGLTGKCLCGGVSFAIPVEAATVDACHCSMCRRWSGGPVMTVEYKGAIAFNGADLIARYPSSDVLDRAFCKACGSALFTKMRGEEQHYFLMAGLIAESDKLTFKVEIFIDYKPHYYAFANDTRKMTGAEFAAAWEKGDDAT